MKKLKKKLLYTLAFGVGDGLRAKEYGYLSLPEIYWRCSEYKEPSIRSALSSCLSNGMVARLVRGRKSQYRLTSVGREALVRACAGDYSASASEKTWIMVVLDQGSLPEKTIRKLSLGLSRLGLISWSRGVWLTPVNISENIKRYIIDIGAAGAVVVIEVKKWFLGDEKVIVEDLWRPLDYEVGVKNLITQAEPLLTTIRSLKSVTEPVKNEFLMVFDRWFEIMTKKPRLPQNLLPSEWSYESGEKLVLKMCESILELEREVGSTKLKIQNFK